MLSIKENITGHVINNPQGLPALRVTFLESIRAFNNNNVYL